MQIRSQYSDVTKMDKIMDSDEITREGSAYKLLLRRTSSTSPTVASLGHRRASFFSRQQWELLWVPVPDSKPFACYSRYISVVLEWIVWYPANTLTEDFFLNYELLLRAMHYNCFAPTTSTLHETQIGRHTLSQRKGSSLRTEVWRKMGASMICNLNVE